MAKITKIRLFTFKGLDGEKYKITLKEKKFCECYLDFKGNGVEAIFEAGYDAKNARVAAAMASEYLTKPNVSAYITLKLEEYGFNDDNVEKQHLFLMNQFGDLPSKKGAIDMFYKKKGSYAAQKVKFVDEHENLTEEQIKEELDRRRKLRKSGKKSDN